MGDAVGGDEAQALLGVIALHDHHGAPEALHRHGPHQGGRVVERGRAQVDVALAEAHEQGEHGGQDGVATQRVPGEGAADALGAARGARGVQHR